MKTGSLFYMLLFSQAVCACECPPIFPVSKELSKSYDVIFLGSVDSVSACNPAGTAVAYFKVTALYKGKVAAVSKLNFDCSSECMMSFVKNDQWLVYANYVRFNELTITLCSHSRKFIEDSKQDYYLVSAKRTFAAEIIFLQTTLGTQIIKKEENVLQELKPHNNQPSAQNKIYLLFISILVMVIIYMITKRKNGK